MYACTKNLLFFLLNLMNVFVAVAYVNLGTALIASGRCEEAIAILRQASKLDGTGVKDRREHENAKMSALLQLGALYSDQGRLHNALAVYREAAANLPKDYPPQVNLCANENAERKFLPSIKSIPEH